MNKLFENTQSTLFLHTLFSNFLHNNPTALIGNESKQILFIFHNIHPQDPRLLSLLTELQKQIKHQLLHNRNYLMFTPDTQISPHKSEIVHIIRDFYGNLKEWLYLHKFSHLSETEFKTLCENKSVSELFTSHLSKTI